MASNHPPTEQKAAKSGVLWSNSGLIGLQYEYKNTFMTYVKGKRSTEKRIQVRDVTKW